MKKITELTEVKWRTVYRKDAYGNRERDTEDYTAKRPVKVSLMAQDLVISLLTLLLSKLSFIWLINCS